MKSWKDITLGTAMELMRLERDVADYEPLDYIMEQLSVLQNRDIADIENQEPAKIFSDFEEWKFISNMPKGKFIPWVKIDKQEYGVTPFDKITLAQMVDIEEYYKNGMEDNLDKIISILLLPVSEKTLFGKKTLADYQYDDERVELTHSLDMEFVWSNMVFFWNGVGEYMKGFLDYLQELTKTTKTMKQTESLPSIMTKYNKQLSAQLSQTRKGMRVRT